MQRPSLFGTAAGGAATKKMLAHPDYARIQEWWHPTLNQGKQPTDFLLWRKSSTRAARRSGYDVLAAGMDVGDNMSGGHGQIIWPD